MFEVKVHRSKYLAKCSTQAYGGVEGRRRERSRISWGHVRETCCQTLGGVRSLQPRPGQARSAQQHSPTCSQSSLGLRRRPPIRGQNKTEPCPVLKEQLSEIFFTQLGASFSLKKKAPRKLEISKQPQQQSSDAPKAALARCLGGGAGSSEPWAAWVTELWAASDRALGKV